MSSQDGGGGGGGGTDHGGHHPRNAAASNAASPRAHVRRVPVSHSLADAGTATVEGIGRRLGGAEGQFIAHKQREDAFAGRFNAHVDALWYNSKQHLQKQDALVERLGGNVEAAVRETLLPTTVSFREELRRRPIDTHILGEIHRGMHGQRRERTLRKGMHHEHWIARSDGNYSVLDGSARARQLLGMGGNIELLAAARSATEFPVTRAPEVAFIGRTNSGKSSVINSIVNSFVCKHGLLPGTTTAAHFYGVAGRLTLVDLPGYGHFHPTQAPQAVAVQAVSVLKQYLERAVPPPSRHAGAAGGGPSAGAAGGSRHHGHHAAGAAPRNVKRVFLCTSSAGLSTGDMAYLEILQRTGVPFGVIMTKTDLVPIRKLAQITDYTRSQLAPFTMCHELMMASSLRLSGMTQLQNLIGELARSGERTSGENEAALDMSALV